jgi:predicted small secreted protein
MMPLWLVFREAASMVRKTLLMAVLVVILLSLFGCETARGIKEDVTFIGDKTAEIIDKDE